MAYSDLDRGISSSELAKFRKREAAMALRDEMQKRWRESERILGILRRERANPIQIDCASVERWFNSVSERPLEPPSSVDSPALWFRARFPEQTERYGSPFFEESRSKGEFVGRCTPTLLNADFFGAALGGEFALGHSVVFVPAEDCLYR